MLRTATEEIDNPSASPVRQRIPQQSPSVIFSRTIQDLEGLLNEALQMARVAVDEHGTEAPAASPRLINVPAHVLNYEAAESVPESVTAERDQASSQQATREPQRDHIAAPSSELPQIQDSIKACGPAHTGRLEVKSSPALPQVSYVLERDWAQPVKTHGYCKCPLLHPRV
jgi:hypothetical protein